MKSFIGTLLILVGLLSLVVLALAGTGYKNEILSLGDAFLILRYAAIAGIAAAVLIIIFAIVTRPSAGRLTLLSIAAVTGLIAFYLPYAQYQTAQSVPPIHDISTDLENPPEFVAIAPLRADAPNPVDYAGEETAVQQREAYPELRPTQFALPAADVFVEALAVVEQSGWELVDSVQNAGDESARIEATATTKWFGFKDDVVIRIVENDNGSVLDIRSKSRVGRSDVGMNAKRINAFLSELQQRIDERVAQ